jgi:hypothetical protein
MRTEIPGSSGRRYSAYTERGEATDNVFVSSIEWLTREIAQGHPCILILDVYPSHRTDLVVETTAANDVELLFVPAEGGQEDSHLSIGGYSGNSRLERNPDGCCGALGGTDIDYNESLQILTQYWQSIPTANIRKA